MTVWILWRVNPYEIDELVDIFESAEAAEKRRHEEHSVNVEFDSEHRIEEYEVKK